MIQTYVSFKYYVKGLIEMVKYKIKARKVEKIAREVIYSIIPKHKMDKDLLKLVESGTYPSNIELEVPTSGIFLTKEERITILRELSASYSIHSNNSINAKLYKNYFINSYGDMVVYSGK